MAHMKRYARMAGLIAALASSCLAQQAAWKAEPQDGLLVAPHAAGVQYLASVTLPYQRPTYTVPEPYPAKRLWKSLCDQLEEKNWHAQFGCSNADEWWKTPYVSHGISRTNYRR